MLSPHLPSPSLQDTSSPIFSNLNSVSPVTAYRTPSIDLHRRSSLTMVDTARMSEPNIFRRSSLDPQKVGGGFNFHPDGGSYTSPLVHSPTHLMPGSSHSPQQCGASINQVPSSSHDCGLAAASPQSVFQTERSKSLENINCSMQPVASQSMKRRMSAQVPLIGAIPSKRPR